MNSQSTIISNIPLHCNVCTKRPHFSDVSHLLTHVASKGHLSNYYKMKVKGSTDRAAKKVVDDYDEWYDEFGLEDMMRDRMSSKEKKRAGGGVGGGGGGGGAASRRVSAAHAHSGRSTPIAGAPRGHRSARLRDNLQLLDPQLGHHLRSEPLSRSGTPNSAFSFDGIPRTYVPSMGHLTFNGITVGSNSFDPQYSPPIKQEASVTTDSDDDDYYEDDPDNMRLRSSTVRQRGTRAIQHDRSESQSVVSTWSAMDEAISIDGMVNDHTRLKGIIWPGMDMFDSATSEAKRKRNQKKHGSVLLSLQATSETVTPTELVFDSQIVLKKEREITGNPESEDDLIEGESEPEAEVTEKKRARRRPRQPMQDKHVNSGRRTRAHGQSHQLPFGRNSRRASYYGGDEDDENDLTYGQHRPMGRRGLSIHRDNTGPDITFDPQPRGMNYLTSTMQNTMHALPFQPQSLQNPNIHQIPRSHQRQPSWNQINGAFRPSFDGLGRASYNQSQFYQPAAAPPMPLPAATTANLLAAFTPQQYQQSEPNPLYQANANAAHGGWDFLDQANDFGSLFSPAHNTFIGSGDGSAPNPLFFPAPKQEDDELTISAKSDR